MKPFEFKPGTVLRIVDDGPFELDVFRVDPNRPKRKCPLCELGIPTRPAYTHEPLQVAARKDEESMALSTHITEMRQLLESPAAPVKFRLKIPARKRKGDDLHMQEDKMISLFTKYFSLQTVRVEPGEKLHVTVEKSGFDGANLNYGLRVDMTVRGEHLDPDNASMMEDVATALDKACERAFDKAVRELDDVGQTMFGATEWTATSLEPVT